MRMQKIDHDFCEEISFVSRNKKINVDIENAIISRTHQILSAYCPEGSQILSITTHYSLYYPIWVEVVVQTNTTKEIQERKLIRRLNLKDFPSVNIELRVEFVAIQ